MQLARVMGSMGRGVWERPEEDPRLWQWGQRLDAESKLCGGGGGRQGGSPTC